MKKYLIDSINPYNSMTFLMKKLLILATDFFGPDVNHNNLTDAINKSDLQACRQS